MDTTGLLAEARLGVLGPAVLVTCIAGALYGFGVSPSDVYLAVAGLGAGAAVTEIAGARDRRDLRDDNRALNAQLRSIREPALVAAVALGMEAVQVTADPASANATFLGVTDELRDMADANDIQGVNQALKTRWGTSVVSAFLLGRELTLLLVASRESATKETGARVEERLLEYTNDRTLASAVARVVQTWDESQGYGEVRMRYIGSVLQYLTGDTSVGREQLVQGTRGVAQPEVDTRPQAAERLIAILMDKGCGDSDPDVLLFHAVFTGDKKAGERAVLAGANGSVTDMEVIRRHRKLLRQEAPELYDSFTSG